MKNINKENVKFIILLVLVIVLSITNIVLSFQVYEIKQKAYADYEDIIDNSESVVNFNQLIDKTVDGSNSTNISMISGNAFKVVSNLTNGSMFQIRNTQFISGHKYYYFGNGAAFRLVDTDGNTIGWTPNDIYTSNKTLYYLNYYSSYGSYDVGQTYYFNIVDLSQMFGIGSEPNLTQCQELFRADYYNYNTGTAVSMGTLSGFAEGVDFLLSNELITYDSETLLNMAQPYYGSYKDSFIQYYTTTGNYPEQRYTDTIMYYNACYIPFLSSVGVSTEINIKALYFGNGAEYGDIPISIYALDSQNNLTLIDAINEGVYSYEKIYTVQNTDIVGLVFINNTDQSSYGKLIEPVITYRAQSITSLIVNSYSQGYNNAKTYYDSYFGINGEGYNQIYNEGVASTQNNSAVFQSSWSFVGSAFAGVGDLLSIEFFPNLPLGIFVAIPLLLGLIFFIVKLTKGGS